MHDPKIATIPRLIDRIRGAGRLAKHGSRSLAWNANARLSILAGRLAGHAGQASIAFARRPIHIGRISDTGLDELQRTILSAGELAFSPDDHAPGYVFNEYGVALGSIFGGGFRFRDLQTPQLDAIGRVLGEVAPELTERLGSGWRAINLKSWTTTSGTIDKGPNAWHYDGFPAGSYKFMIYLTPIGPNTGTTEVKYEDGSTQTLEGPSGTYLLFDPSALLHRGVPPAEKGAARTHVELTLVRWPYADNALAFGGLNSSVPAYPWRRNVVWRPSARPHAARVEG